MKANQRNDLRPASAWHGAKRTHAAGDVIEVQVGRRRKQSVRRLDQLRVTDSTGQCASGQNTTLCFSIRAVRAANCSSTAMRQAP